MHPATLSSRFRPAGLVALLATLLVVAGISAAPRARAATINVTEDEDELNTDGDCSLREAIVAANTNDPVDECTSGSGGVIDQINVPDGIYQLTIEGTDEDEGLTGDLDVNEGVRIVGGGRNDTIITAGGDNQQAFCQEVIGPSPTGEVEALGEPAPEPQEGIDRVFHAVIPQEVEAAGGGGLPRDFELRALEVTGGTDFSSGVGGGVLSEDFDLAMTNVDVVDNLAANKGVGLGGGIAADSDIDLDRVALVDNTALAGFIAAGGGLIAGAGSPPVAAASSDASKLERGRRIIRALGVPAPEPTSVVDSRFEDNAACAYDIAAGGGAALGNSTASFEDSDFISNFALSQSFSAGGGLDGGGFAGFFVGDGADTSLVMDGGTFRDNAVVHFGGGGCCGAEGGSNIVAGGGGLATDTDTTLTRLLIEDNSVIAPFGTQSSSTLAGGGIFHGDDRFTLRRSLLKGNSVNPITARGEIGTEGFSTFGVGGGLYSQDRGNVINSTFSANSAQAGGGIAYVPVGEGKGSTSPGPLTLTHVTVTDNEGHGVMVDESQVSGNVRLDSSIVALQAQGQDCSVQSKGDGLTSLGYNMDSDDTCDLDGPGDKPNRDPKLGPLQDTDSADDVHPLKAASPGVDAVALSACPPPGIDQRGEPRPQDGDANGTAKCDMGAAERLGPDVEPKFCPGFAGDPRNQIVGGPAGDVLVGTGRPDIICGLGGGDTLRGLGGGDLILGGRGPDTMRGAAGADTMNGGPRGDQIFGGPAGDRMRGKNGADLMAGQGGADVIRSGAGPDLGTGGPGDDRMFAYAGDDLLNGNLGADFVFGSEDDDELHGGVGPDEVRGFTGDDQIFGEEGNDLLAGWRGSDHLNGGPNHDECYPGPGVDTKVNCEGGAD